MHIIKKQKMLTMKHRQPTTHSTWFLGPILPRKCFLATSVVVIYFSIIFVQVKFIFDIHCFFRLQAVFSVSQVLCVPALCY